MSLMPFPMRATLMPYRRRPRTARCKALRVRSVSTRTIKWAFERGDMKKAQLSIYLDPEIFGSLEAFAKRQGKPKSLVAEAAIARSEEHTSELQSRENLVCRLLLEKK